MDDNHPETVDLAKLKEDFFAVLEDQYDVIIIEGLLTLWDKDIYQACDLKLFVDCKADERIVRRIRRNMTWGLTYDQIADVYLDMVRYRHDEYVEPAKWRADLILNGSLPTKQALDVIACYIKAAHSTGKNG
ncbi:Uridine kinase [compost metagenome]